MAKKEEALKEVTDILEKYYGSGENLKVAKEILDSLEKKIGMLPPSRYLEMLAKYDNGWED